MPGVMEAEFAINGSFGTLMDENGNIISEVQILAATITHNRHDLMRAGTRAVAYKLMTTQGAGTLTVIKVTSDFLKIISEVFRDPNTLQRQMVLRVKIADPESLGVEEYRLTGVKFWDIPFGFNVNTILEEAMPFTFEGFEPTSWIGGDPTVSQHASRYHALD